MIFKRSKLTIVVAVSIAAVSFLWIIGYKILVHENETYFFQPVVGISVPELPKEVSFIIGGDVMFGRDILHTFGVDKLGDSVQGLLGVFDGYDARIVNLEGAISEKRIDEKKFVGYPHSFTFIFQPEVVSILSSLNINAVSLANNHSINAGTAGLEKTRELLINSNIQAIGGPNKSDVQNIAVFGSEDFPLTVIGVNCTFSKPDIVEEITSIRLGNLGKIIVFAHWGEEYKKVHSKEQEELAHSWIEAGADMIIGAHPHVVQDTELYKGKPIFYSLGNLLFDQWFSDETQHGMIVAGKFTKDALEFSAIPTAVFEKGSVLDETKNIDTILESFYTPFSVYKVQAGSTTSIVIPNDVL